MSLIKQLKCTILMFIVLRQPPFTYQCHVTALYSFAIKRSQDMLRDGSLVMHLEKAIK